MFLAQMDSNYPLVRLTDRSGNIYYARTYSWSSTGVMTGISPVTTEFALPLNLRNPGTYSLVVANGLVRIQFLFTGQSGCSLVSPTQVTELLRARTTLWLEESMASQLVEQS